MPRWRVRSSRSSRVVRWMRRPGWRRGARRRRTVTSGWRSSHGHEAPERRRREVAQHRGRTARLHGREEAALERELRVTNRVDAAVDPVQAAVAHAVRHSVSRQAAGKQLIEGEDAPLVGGGPRDARIGTSVGFVGVYADKLPARCCWGAGIHPRWRARSNGTTRTRHNSAQRSRGHTLRSMLPALIAAVSVATTTSAAAPPPTPRDRGLHASQGRWRTQGPRPAGSPAERRAHQASRSASAPPACASASSASPSPARGRRATSSASATPPRGAWSSSWRTPTPSRPPPAPTTTRRASARSSPSRPPWPQGRAPRCDTWLVATGSEERPYTRQPDHLGAAAPLVTTRLRRTHRPRATSASPSPSTRSVAARASSCALRSPKDADRARPSEHTDPRSGQSGRTSTITWLRDSATGNSDHRELAARAARRAAQARRARRAAAPHREGHARPPPARRLRPRAARRVAAAARAQLTDEHPLRETLGQRDRAQVRVRPRDRRHDRGVGDRQAFAPEHPPVAVDHRADRARADRMEEAPGGLAHVALGARPRAPGRTSRAA